MSHLRKTKLRTFSKFAELIFWQNCVWLLARLRNWNLNLNSNRTERWNHSCGIEQVCGFENLNGKNTAEFLTGFFINFFFSKFKENENGQIIKRTKSTKTQHCIKIIAILVLNQRSLQFCYVWFSCGKSSHTKPQLFLYKHVRRA